MPEACENWLGVEYRCIYYALQTREIYQVLHDSVDVKAPRKLWNPLSKRVFSKLKFMWNKGPVNLWNNTKNNLDL